MQSANPNRKICPVLGVPLAATDYAAASAYCHAFATDPSVREGKSTLAVAATATHPVTLARHDPEFRAVLAKFDLIVPDGMPLVWIMNLQGAGLRDRVYGPTLMLHVLAIPGASHFFLGGSEELLAILKTRLLERFPHLSIAGSYSPPFSPDGVWSKEENDRMLQKIAESGAQCIWVGLGCPKQELWIAYWKAVCI